MKKLLTPSLILAVATSLSSCSLWDNYKHPQTKTPAAWDNKAGENNAWPDENWWKQFDSPTLNKLMESSVQNNFDLKAASARVLEADAQAKIAGAALLPAVGVEADASRTRNGINSNNSSSHNNYNATATASYELDFWGKNWSAEKAAEALAEGSRYDEETVVLTITSSVANIYFDILATEGRIKVNEANLKDAQKLLATIKHRQSVGIESELDVAQQESVVDSQISVLPPLKLELAQDKSALAILLGKLPEDTQLPAEDIASIKAPQLGAGLPSELLQRRPDVQSAEAQLIAADANIVNARAQFFPDINLTAQGGYASTALSTLTNPGNALFSLGGSLTQPIFEGGALTGALNFSKARYDELLQDYKKSVISAFSDVENALSGVEQNVSGEDIATKAEKDSRKAYEISQRQYAEGILDITTLLNTERVMFNAQNALLQARLAKLESIVTLYQALGGGWKKDDIITTPAMKTPAAETLAPVVFTSPVME